MTRDSILFYRSFYDSLKELPRKQRLEAYEVIFEYGLNGIEPSCNGVVSALFALIRPQIDANNKKYINGQKGAEHGKKGGRPKKETRKKEAINLEFIKDNTFKEVVKKWIDYKKSIGNTYKTQSTVEAMAKKLWSISEGSVEVAAEIVEQSIVNNWKGLFELKNKKNGTADFDFKGIARVSGELKI